MTLIRDALRALRLTAVLWLITVVLYTLPILAIGQGLLPFQANGSLLRVDGTVVGSALVGQPFASDRYFWSRPSAVDYSTGTQPSSGPSNLGPSNPELVKRIGANAAALMKGGLGNPAPDLLYSSGSGLDPHIFPRGGGPAARAGGCQPQAQCPAAAATDPAPHPRAQLGAAGGSTGERT